MTLTLPSSSDRIKTTLEKPASLGSVQQMGRRENRPWADFPQADRTGNPVVKLCPPHLEKELVPEERTNLRQEPVGEKLIHKTGLFPVKSINQMFGSEDSLFLVEAKHATTFLQSPCENSWTHP